ncbi:glycogen synthase GlgA [Ramlibacter sp. PS4R-6]|uniref:glycogen synthase GlgA n=1 Tax=Ramlibacter sp. PS4R-6 TaxID=3133438 RepID=UPI0030B65072
MKILFATPECAPFVKTGGLGDVSGALPQALERLGHDVRVLMPAYGGMKVDGDVEGSVDLPGEGHWPAAQLITVQTPTVKLLLLSCPALFDRAGGPYVAPGGQDHHDNAFRFGFLSRVAARIGLPSTPLAGWQADVVHANDWPCGLAPLYLADWRSPLPRGQRAAGVVTIHNIAFQGIFPMATADVLQIPWHWRGMDAVEFWGQMSMLKGALQFSDAITTVSPTYADEIRTEAFGVGLHGVLQAQSHKLTGILNGIDTAVWNPRTDPLLVQNFGAADLAARQANKAALQAHCALALDRSAMLFGVVSRLTSQKGIDLVLQLLPRMVEHGAQLVVLGQGEPWLHEALQAAAQRHPRSVSANFAFDEGLAHNIEAGIDCFLMPSRFEPCGLNQMYSQAYGAPPIVAPTGGLKDSVVDADADRLHGSGFVMKTADAAGFEDAVLRAFAAFADKDRWQRIQRNGMDRDFGWDRSAQQYVRVYEAALAAARG